MDKAVEAAAGVPTAEDMLARAQALVPMLRAQAARCEAERRVSSDVIAALHEARLFDVVKPRRYGGFEMGWVAFSDVASTIASGCGSVGWVYAVVGSHSGVVPRFGSALLDDIWDDDANAIISSSRSTGGTFERVKGGIRGSGASSYSSGCLNAQWILVEDVAVAGEEQKLTVILPTKSVQILDTWHVAGLAGTGSNDVRFENVFIPDHHTWHPGAAPHGEAVDGPSYRFHALGAPGSLPSAVIGMALHGLEEFARLTNKRWSRVGGSMRDLPAMQMRIGESAGDIEAARIFLRAKLAAWMERRGGRESATTRALSALSATGADHYDPTVSGYVAHRCYRATERLMAAAGAAQLATSSAFQRCFRDVLAGVQQPSQNWDNGRVMGGRNVLQRLEPAASGG